MIAKFMGMFPMSFEGSTRIGVFSVKWHDALISIAYAATIVIFISCFMSIELVFMEKSKILMEAWTVLSNLEMISHLFLFLYQVYKHKSVVKFLTSIHQFDEEVKLKISHDLFNNLKLIFRQNGSIVE